MSRGVVVVGSSAGFEEGEVVVELRKSWREGPRFPKTMCFFFFLSVAVVLVEVEAEVVVEADWLLVLVEEEESVVEVEVGGGTIVLVVVASPRWETSVRLRTSLQALVVSIGMSSFVPE